MSKPEVQTIKVTKESGTNGSNLVYIAIEEEEEEEVNEFFEDCFYD